METARILVVDDDSRSQRMTGDLLGREGYELVFASTGTAALEEATRKAPDVVLLDILMPDMDGYEVCRHLRLDPFLSEVPIIMVTALDDRLSRIRGLEAGADDFVSKPVDEVELKTRVRNVVNLNRYRKLVKERMKSQLAQAETLSSCEATLGAWVRILERDGSVVPGRSDRIMGLAMRLGAAMGLANAGLVALRWSVLLQEIGAMAVPMIPLDGDACVMPGRMQKMALSREAWIIEALSPVMVLREALEIMVSLHEHWDGSGLPAGLKGEAIPLGARVLAVALAWEPDQPCVSPGTTARLAALKEQSGHKFEPRLVETLEQLLQDPQEPEVSHAQFPVVVVTPAEEARPRRTMRQRLSMSSTGARAQFAVAIALMSVIPTLTMLWLFVSGWLGFQPRFEALGPTVAIVLPLVLLGGWMLVRYPINIIRMRRYLESLAQGTIPSHIALVKDEDDLASIETLMNRVIEQTEARVCTIKAQGEALLDAERQRVMIESMGSACHHIAQPATVISTYVQMLMRMELPPQVHAMLEDCLTASDAVAGTLERLQRLIVYRTEPYLTNDRGAAGPSVVDAIVKV